MEQKTNTQMIKKGDNMYVILPNEDIIEIEDGRVTLFDHTDTQLNSFDIKGKGQICKTN